MEHIKFEVESLTECLLCVPGMDKALAERRSAISAQIAQMAPPPSSPTFAGSAATPNWS
jgi:hypothetical protein